MIRNLFLVGAAVMVILCGCQNTAPSDSRSPAPPAVSLTDRQWNLTALHGTPIVPADVPDHAPHITFVSKDNSLAGAASVNRFFGTWSNEGGKLSVKPMGMSMMAGPEPLMKQEQAFMKALSTVTGYRIEGKTLTLLAGEHNVATLTAAE